MDIINTALSGLSASATRMAVSANNIANAQSTISTENGKLVNKAYVAQQVEQQSVQGGGTATSLRDVSPPTIPVFAPEATGANEKGIIEFPNVNIEQEMVNQVQASNVYKANLNTIKRADEMFKSMLDISG